LYIPTSGYPKFQVGTIRSKNPTGDLGANLDFRTLTNMLVLLKKEVEVCIGRLEMGQGLLGLASSVGHVMGASAELKPKPKGGPLPIRLLVRVRKLQTSL
jgi:hypothetical protein